MTKFTTIESWASSIGYVVEKNDVGFVWYKENTLLFHRCSSAEEAAEQILSEIRNSLGASE